MRAHPDLVGGPGRAVTRLLAGIPGLVAKDGAEGVFAAALPDGSAAAVKVTDGANRASHLLLVAALRALGATEPVLDELASSPVLGGGRPVGELRGSAELVEAVSSLTVVR
jgi:L-asparaginase II